MDLVLQIVVLLVVRQVGRVTVSQIKQLPVILTNVIHICVITEHGEIKGRVELVQHILHVVIIPVRRALVEISRRAHQRLLPEQFETTERVMEHQILMEWEVEMLALLTLLETEQPTLLVEYMRFEERTR